MNETNPAHQAPTRPDSPLPLIQGNALDLALDLVATAAGSLADADARFTAEQAVQGLDALSEVALHAILELTLVERGWGVHREVLYPGDYEPGDTARDRCDLVLTQSPAARLLDPVHAERRVQAAQDTLFAGQAQAMEHAASADAVAPVDAMWLEIKVVAQHAYRDGVPGPNRAYGTEIINGPAADICKLMGDGVIENAAIVLILFTETEEVSQHDVSKVAHSLLDMGLPIGAPEYSSVPISDRAGNACATIAVFSLRGLGILTAFEDLRDDGQAGDDQSD